MCFETALSTVIGVFISIYGSHCTLPPLTPFTIVCYLMIQLVSRPYGVHDRVINEDEGIGGMLNAYRH
jgi:hypothetical protein